MLWMSQSPDISSLTGVGWFVLLSPASDFAGNPCVVLSATLESILSTVSY